MGRFSLNQTVVGALLSAAVCSFEVSCRTPQHTYLPAGILVYLRIPCIELGVDNYLGFLLHGAATVRGGILTGLNPLHKAVRVAKQQVRAVV